MRTFEVREFRIEAAETETIWNFKLGNMNKSQVDFYAEEESMRSLFHLAKDMSNQI